MAGSGVNLATTKDGGAYNKLTRPDYLISANIPPPPKKQRPSSDFSATCANKRRHKEEQNRAGKKRAKLENGSSVKSDQCGLRDAIAYPMRDPDCGMRAVLPGLNDEDFDPEGFMGDALVYLRSVGSEASTIPHLLVARDSSPDRDDESTIRNFLCDDATWIAVEGLSYAQSDLDMGVADLNPQDRFYDVLLQRFHDIRTTIAHLATAEHEKVQDSKPKWYDTMEEEYPNPRHITSLSRRSLFRGLEACTHTINDLSSCSIPPQLSCWIWSLLASVDDGDTLSHERISNIRDLGHEIGLLGVRMREDKSGRMNSEDIGSEEGEVSEPSQHHPAERTSPTPASISESDAEMSLSGDESSVPYAAEDAKLQQARARLLAQLNDRLVQNPSAPEKITSPDEDMVKHNSSNDGSLLTHDALHDEGLVFDDKDSGFSVDLNTRLTIDMVLTVVAERFGQKDLLRYRQPW